MSKFAQPKWELDCIFAEGQVAALVERLSVSPIRYSYKIGVVPQNGVFKPFFDPRTDPQAILRVAIMAHDYIAMQYADQEVRALASTKKTAEKDASKARKKANHEANIARRREEDRQRTQVGKDGNRQRVK